MSLFPRLFATLLLGAALLAACDSADPGGDFVPPEDEIVAGINLTALFAPPTLTEQSAVRDAWATRDAGLAARYRFAFVEARPSADGAELRIYRAQAAVGDSVLFHGVVRLPPRPSSDVRLRPLLLVLPDGDTGTSATVLTNGSVPIGALEPDALTLALLAYRGTPLSVDDTTFASEVLQSPYDRDSDDALAFLGFVRGLGLSALVDPARVGVLGLGRGGGTALLTEPRPNPYRIVIDLAGPTDLFLPSFQESVRALLQDRDPGDFPGLDRLAEEIVYPLRDGRITPEQARFELLLRSARYFAVPPPFVLAAHGALDPVVPPAHSRVLDLNPPNTSGESEGVYLEVENADHESLPSDGEVISLVANQLRVAFDL